MYFYCVRRPLGARDCDIELSELRHYARPLRPSSAVNLVMARDTVGRVGEQAPSVHLFVATLGYSRRKPFLPLSRVSARTLVEPVRIAPFNRPLRVWSTACCGKTTLVRTLYGMVRPDRAAPVRLFSQWETLSAWGRTRVAIPSSERTGCLAQFGQVRWHSTGAPNSSVNAPSQSRACLISSRCVPAAADSGDDLRGRVVGREDGC